MVRLLFVLSFFIITHHQHTPTSCLSSIHTRCSLLVRPAISINMDTAAAQWIRQRADTIGDDTMKSNYQELATLHEER
jgi:hypothetical protein